MGAVLGKTTPLQLVVMGFVEMAFFAANEYLSSHVLQAVDLGGSMVVHVFGAYFGLAVSRALGRPGDTAQERSSYTSDMFSMVGKSAEAYLRKVRRSTSVSPGRLVHLDDLSVSQAPCSCGCSGPLSTAPWP